MALLTEQCSQEPLIRCAGHPRDGRPGGGNASSKGQESGQALADRERMHLGNCLYEYGLQLGMCRMTGYSRPMPVAPKKDTRRAADLKRLARTLLNLPKADPSWSSPVEFFIGPR